MTSCDASLLRQVKSELATGGGEKVPYRKLSLTPNLPRLEQRTSLNNHPLQKHSHKFSTSEDSDLLDSDLNLNNNYLDQQPQMIPTIVTHLSSDSKLKDVQESNSSSTSLRSGTHSSSSNMSSGGGHATSPADHVTSSSPTRRVQISTSSPSLSEISRGAGGNHGDRRSNSDPEHQTPEPDKLPELSVTDKLAELSATVIDRRKTFAFKKRKQNLLTPNVLTDIGERSDNSDQSFDYGDGTQGAGASSQDGVPESGSAAHDGSSETSSEV